MGSSASDTVTTTHRRLRRRTRAVTGLAAAAALLTACGGSSTEGVTSAVSSAASDAPAGRTKIAVGVAGSLTSIPIYLAQSKGYFTEEGLEPTLTVAQSGAATIPQLLNGQLQFSIADTVATIGAVSNGVPLQIISTDVVGAKSGAEDFVGVVTKDVAPGNLKAMEGKTLAVNQLKGLAELLSRATLDGQGVDSTKVKFVEVPPPDMPAAVSQGRVDAAYALEPFLSGSKAAGLKDLFSITDVSAGLPIVSFSASRDYVSKNPDVVAKFNRAVGKATAYAAANPEEARAAAAYTKLPPPVLATVRLPSFATDSADVSGVGKISDLMVKYGFLTKAPDPASYVGATG